MRDKTTVILGDCMDGLRNTEDKFYDLAICDVPYGINASQMTLGEGAGSYRAAKKYKRGDWDVASPESEYFGELLRVSENQILWGANHFISKIPLDSRCWIIWDKNNGGSDFADAELAWTSFKSPVRLFKYTWSGYIQDKKTGSEREDKIHPTQKPVGLYKWLLKNYAKEGDKILDTHVGSGSSRIAAFDMGFEYVGYEIDADYWAAAEKRFNQHKAQLKLFV
ncbi:MAG TPA: DNA methyltransferase [Ohtaekwangia sp.]|nr:DNA methyltransferase [Ohtaekwangia sp.]